MTGRFAAAIAQAAEASPMNQAQQPLVAGRTLLADGDGLCYYCAGNDETAPGTARHNMLEKLEAARRASGAEDVMILLTARGSHKGHRYAIARAKPYQGQRRDHKPNNWQFLRDTLETGQLPGHIRVVQTADAEADDLFARYALGHPDCVIYTQDKDMRMVPGVHLDWLTHVMITLQPGAWAHSVNDKLYGRKWFWMQMLQGDQADNIPGLPKYATTDAKGKPALKLVGEKTAAVLLEDVHTDMGACLQVSELYRGFYKDAWMAAMLEQACLLWMRNDQAGHLFNVAQPGNPLAPLATHEDFAKAQNELMQRVVQSMIQGSNGTDETQDDTGSGNAEPVVDAAAGSVCAVQTPVLGAASSAGPRPPHGEDQGDATQDVQCVAGQDRELRQQLRHPKPVSIPAWQRLLLAKARN